MVGHIEILAARDESLQRPAQFDVKPLPRTDGDTNASSDVVDERLTNRSLPVILHLGPLALRRSSPPRSSKRRRLTRSPHLKPINDEV
jgi:hypothetical protein